MNAKVNDSFDRNPNMVENAYDKALIGANWYMRLYNRMFWNEPDSRPSTNRVLSYIPKCFSKKLLDVPAGTGVFTAETYLSLKDADIYGVDYSYRMLEQYRKRLTSMNQDSSHIKLMHGDVGDLQFDDDSFDLVVSMNGIHCFPDKPKALEEIHRVLKPGGHFIGCTYAKGVNKRTDFFVKNIYDRKGIFMPPHESFEEFKLMVTPLFEIDDIGLERSFTCFNLIKGV